MVGVTRNTGGATGRVLLERGVPLRAIVRDPARAAPWISRGAGAAVADLADADSLARAFEGVRAAYVLNPPAYAMPDIFARAERLAESIREAARRAGLPRLVVLSSIGAHLPSDSGNIRTNSIFERILGDLPASVVFLRPAYFMENWAWVAAAAAQRGVLPSFLSPPERAIPMVSAADVGRAAADAMLGGEEGHVCREITGPRDCSPDDAAAAFAKALGRPVTAAAVPESDWPADLAKSHFSPTTIASWVELFRGFNSARIGFERPEAASRGRVSIEEAIAAVLREK